MISRRLLGMNKMMKGGGAFNLPIFKRKKKNIFIGIGRRKKTTTSKGNNIGGGGGTGIVTSTSTSNSIDDDWFVFEILTRLPVKSLFRFKSVSKNWCSLIQKDQQVMDLHFTRSKTRLPPRIFIVLPLPPTKVEQYRLRKFGRFVYSRKKKLHITADLVSEEEEEPVYNNNGVPTGRGTKLKLVVDTIREINKPSYHTISKPVNGLICLIDKYTKPVARICNISTGELSPWFPLNHCIDLSYYGFGFDPSTNEYKLLYVWIDDDSNYFGDVFTIGLLGIQNNNTQRRIQVPQLFLTNDYVYVSGVIYWCPPNYPTKSFVLGEFFVAFDVGSEKFRTIRIPHFILRDIQIPDDDARLDNVGKLFEVNGSLAMVVRLNNQTFKMYLYRDDGKEDEKIDGVSTTSPSHRKNGRWREKKENNRKWSEVSTITLPFQMGNDHRVKFHTFVGSDDKIFITSSILGMEKKKCVSIYCYNWKKFSLTKVNISGIPPSIPQLCPQNFFTAFSESLLSIDSQCSRARP